MRKANLVLALTGSLLCAVAIADTDHPAVIPVAAFHDTLLQIMQQPVFDQRLGLAGQAVSEQFNTTTIARISLGSRHWRSLSPADRREFEALLHQLIASTYASRFSAYSGQVFRTLRDESISEDRHRVRCELVTSDDTVSLDYQLQQQDGQWRIYDVAANGVSDLSLKRSNYAALLKNGGIESVMQDIRQEIAENLPDRQPDPNEAGGE